MKRLIKVEYFDNETPIKIYTIRFLNSDGSNEELSETNKFLSNYYEKNKEEIDLFLSILDIMQNKGVRENYLRNERNKDCSFLFALLYEDEEGKNYKGGLRLYCLYYGDNKLILGNGSMKVTKKLQDDENLVLIAKDLQELNKEIERKIEQGEVWWEESELKSKNGLIFEIEE